MNPIIKFTTLFGLLAVEMAVGLSDGGNALLTHLLAVGFLALCLVFVWRSFYAMRIGERDDDARDSGTGEVVRSSN
jgi:K(+)-stimulated pyrophosphate-energized sodium pump